MPPSHAGMVPAALPAFSAPTGVSVVPSLARSAAESSAAAGAANAAPTASARNEVLRLENMFVTPPSLLTLSPTLSQRRGSDRGRRFREFRAGWSERENVSRDRSLSFGRGLGRG